MKNIILKTKSRDVNVFIDASEKFNFYDFFKEALRDKKALVITDSNVDEIYGKKIIKELENIGAKPYKFVFKAGESSKSINTVVSAYTSLCENAFTRSDVIIALGGGVTGDVAGFIASTYLRGIEYYQIPTTMLAMIDSSIGGKTGIDLPHGKNLAGTFYQPNSVYINTLFLKTLSDAYMRDGLAEAVKYACIDTPSIFEDIENSDYNNVILKSVKIKCDIVSGDEFDKGQRMLLNFGHTIGHAVEKCMDFKGITHGQAVAIGMVHAVKMGNKLGYTPLEGVDKLIDILNKLELPIHTDIYKDKLLQAITIDKKNMDGYLNFILIKEFGNALIEKIKLSELIKYISI